MMTKTLLKTTWPTLAAVAVICTAGSAFGQEFSTSGLRGSNAGSGTDGATCGPGITQNVNPDLLVAGTVACSAAGVNTDNFYARNFPLGAPITVSCVDFGVETCTPNPWPVVVNLYSSPNPGTPVTASLTLLGTSTVMIPAGTTNTMFTASFGAGVAVPAGNLVVELFIACRQTVAAPPGCPVAGDGGSIFLGSNAAGETAPTYLKAASCGAAEYVDIDGLCAPCPNVHIVMVVGEGGPVDECAQPLGFCPSDIAPGGGDNTVGIPDLLAVINTWGQNGQPTGPRPLGDVRPLPNGDCLVGVPDLLGVINEWGPCPEILGACCDDLGNCTEVTEVDCDAAGGTYQGDFTLCVDVVCPVLPINDDPCGRILLAEGVHSIDNTAATDGTFLDADCIFPVGSGQDNFNKDLWYSYTATCTGNLNVDLCATTGTVTDTTLAMYSGPCASPTIIACDDDACTGNPAGDRSRLTALVTMGETYLIRVGTWGGNPGGPMELTIGPCAVLDNDACADATEIAIGGNSGPQDINGGNNVVDFAPACNGVPVELYARWYTVIGDGNTLTAETCTGSPAGFWGVELSVYCGANCSSLFCVTAANAPNEDNCGNGFFDSVSWCSAAGQKYWIVVHTSDPAGEGMYQLNVTSDGTPCGPAVLCGEPGDECESAFAAALGDNAGDSTAATTSVGAPAACATMSTDQWWEFTASSTGPHVITTCGGAAFDTVIQVLSGTCGSLTQIGCNDDACALQSSVGLVLTMGETYLIRVGSFGAAGAGGAYTLNISESAGCGACPGGATQEAAPQCPTNGDSALADPNGGCNSEPDVFGGPIVVDEVVCGQLATYNPAENPAGNYRDLDFFLFTPTTTGSYAIEVCGDVAINAFFFNYVVSPCGGTQLHGATVPPFTLTETPSGTLTAGTTYRVLIGLTVFTGVPCSNYRFRVVDGAPPPPPLGGTDDCASAPNIGSGNISGTFDNTGMTSNDTAILTCDQFGDSNTIFEDLWLRWTSTVTGTVTVSTCGSALDTKVAMYNDGCPPASNSHIGCADDVCGVQAEFTASVTSGSVYLIRIGTWQDANPTGTGTLTITGSP